MKITIQNTTKLVEVNGVPARVWEGKTDSGIAVQCLVTRIAAPKTDNLAQFEAELKEQAPPSAEVAAFPMRMII